MIEFFCAICGQSLTAPAEYAGNVIGCPSCERAVPVPGCPSGEDGKPSWQPAFSADILSVEITFVCPGCRDPLVADARYSGEPFDCPKCAATGQVPRWIAASSLPAERHAPAVVHAAALSAEEIDFLSGALGEEWAAVNPPG